MKLSIVAICCLISGSIQAGEVKVLHMDSTTHMTRADLEYVETVPNPKAVLVLCPGCNGNGGELIRSVEWQNFARSHHLGLVGLSFASSIEAIQDGTGYYYASKESGKKLIDGIRKIYGLDLPLLLYGFSGGAHFTSRFEEWEPQRLIAWCAYSAGWWDAPRKSAVNPPGIVACGDRDERYGATVTYFKQGRVTAKPWLWVSLPETGHAVAPKFDDFVRKYFSIILDDKEKNPEIVDIDRKTITTEKFAQTYPSLTAWLPSADLFVDWDQIHSP